MSNSPNRPKKASREKVKALERALDHLFEELPENVRVWAYQRLTDKLAVIGYKIFPDDFDDPDDDLDAIPQLTDPMGTAAQAVPSSDQHPTLAEVIDVLPVNEPVILQRR